MQKENAEINESVEINREIFTVAYNTLQSTKVQSKKTIEKHKK